MNKTTVHFLVVEDDDDHAELIGLALEEQRGISFDRVSDGRAAISYLRQEGGFEGSPRPDVVLLDLTMPGLTGEDVLSEIERARPGQPVVLMSGYNEELAAPQLTERITKLSKPASVTELFGLSLTTIRICVVAVGATTSLSRKLTSCQPGELPLPITVWTVIQVVPFPVA